MSSFYNNLIRPLLFRIDPERAHEMTLKALEVGLNSKIAKKTAERLYGSPDFRGIERFGLTFSNPVGVAAGFDKNGKVVGQLGALGFGFVEVGTLTLEPQKGNEKPRLFRLPKDQALINRLGFNNEGVEAAVERLTVNRPEGIIGINIGKNRDVPVEAAAEDYLKCFEFARKAADYIVVNISSPNTPGLRDLQASKHFEELINTLQTANNVGGRSIPLLVKIAPDITESALKDICDISIQYGISGIVATNTTVSREGLCSPEGLRAETGGLSGKPIFSRSNEVISSVFRHTAGRLPMIGVGGIFNGRDAFEKIRAGASLVQAYTGFVYSGPSFARIVNTELLRLLNENGFENLDDAIGTGIENA